MQYKKELCRNYQRGSCQYGARCKFIHATQQQQQSNNNNVFGSTNQNQNQKPNPFGFGVANNPQPKQNQNQFKPFENKWSRFSPIQNTADASSSRKSENQAQSANHKCSDPEACKRLIVEDFEHERPLWKLTCYAHWKNSPCDIVGDVSYEELRAAAYDDAKRGLSLQSIVERERNMLNSKLVEFDSLLRNPYTGPHKSGVASHQSSFPAAMPNAFISTPQNSGPQNAFSALQNSTTPNAFGATAQNSAPPTVSSFSQLGSSINTGFGTRPSTPSNNAFGQPMFPNPSQTSSLFTTNNGPMENSGPFGSQFPPQTTGSSFNSNTTSNQFSSPSAVTPNTNPFSFGNQSTVQPSNPVTSINTAIQSLTTLESATFTGDPSIWLKEKWLPGEIPEEAPPEAFVK